MATWRTVILLLSVWAQCSVALMYTEQILLSRLSNRYIRDVDALHVDVNVTRHQNCSIQVQFSRVNVSDERPLLLNYSIMREGESVADLFNGTGRLDKFVASLSVLYLPDPPIIYDTNCTLFVYVVNETGHRMQTIEESFLAPRCLSAAAKRDPHLTTFDGHHFSYHGLCWHTLVLDCRGFEPRFEVLAKFEPLPTADPEIRSRIANVDVYVDNYLISLAKDNSVMVNGRQVSIPKFRVGDENIKVFRQDDHVTFKLKEAEMVLRWYGREHLLYITLSSDQFIGKVCGLLGNADGNDRNDFIKRDGHLTTDVVEFGESWSVPQISCE